MLIRRMLKYLFLICFLASPLWAQVTSENDTVRFKFTPTSLEDPDVLEKAIELYWISGMTGVRDNVAMAMKLRGDQFEDVWLWQTYAFTKAETSRWVSPKLPSGCRILNMGANFNGEKFAFSVNFQGLPCKELPEILMQEKIHIEYVNVPVIDETTIAPIIHFYVDDLPEVIRSLRI